jgi:stromal membrane-associated protein
MGTHISRVKSVDLDSWTDEQLQSVLKWGNARANKYWEAKLAPGHVPSEAKIENFIRTKYESKRWTMEGPIPDPSTLDAEGDDDVPLSLVKEKHSIERSASQRVTGSVASPTPVGPSQVRRTQQPDLFGSDSPPPRSSTAGPTPTSTFTKSEPAPPKQTKPADSLFGLDFFGDAAPASSRPSSTTPTPGVQSRPDLKQSILSLYASRPPAPSQQPSHSHSGSFGGMQSGPPPQVSPQQASFGGMNDAFGGLSFSNPSSPPSQPAAKPNAFSNLGNLSGQRTIPSQVSPPFASGGSFFDAKPAPRPTQQPPQPSRAFSSSSGFGAFDSAPGSTPAAVNSSSGMGDMFDFSAPAPAPPPKQTVASPPAQTSVFNLSQPAPQAKAAPAVAATTGWGNDASWGVNDVWSTSQKNPPVTKPPPPQTSSGWGVAGLANQSIVPGASGFTPAKPAPKVSADEDFGGWSSAAPATPASGTAAAKPATGFTASEDLFSNVWE